jgi:hypothetical protein
VAAALARLAAGLEDVAEPDEREAALRAAFRQAVRPASTRQRRGWRWAWAVAACCLLVVAGFALRVRTGTPSQVQVSALQVPAPAPSPTAAAPRTRRPARPASPRPSRAEAVREVQPPSLEVSAPAAVAATAAPELPLNGPPDEPGRGVPARFAESSAGAAPEADERGFYPVGPGLDASSLESGQILRVRLRPDVLDKAGLPPRGAAHGPVEAEVLVGPDGVARGIRLASPRRWAGSRGWE